MWWIAALAALAEPAAEEIVVYDQRALWDGTRFLIQSEQALSTGVVLGTEEGGSFRSPAWQLELVAACELAGRQRATCTVEDAALRSATVDLWQRPADLERVQWVLTDVRRSLLGQTLDIRFDRHGALVQADATDSGEDDHMLHLTDMATRVLGGVALPAGALEDGAVWFTPSDRLLRAPGTVDAYQTAVVHHFGNTLSDHYIVQTIGLASMSVWISPVQDREQKDWQQAQDLEAFGDLGRHVEEAFGQARMTAVASFDPATGILEERVFSVAAGQPRAFWHNGSVRRLAPEEHPELGSTQQVTYPGSRRPSLAPWASLQRIALPEDETW